MTPSEAAFGNETSDAMNPLHYSLRRFEANRRILDEQLEKKVENNPKLHNFRTGDRVWYRNSSTTSRSGFQKRNLGPYQIKEFIGTELVELGTTEGGPRLHYLQRRQHIRDLLHVKPHEN
jgi:hypothetical protein